MYLKNFVLGKLYAYMGFGLIKYPHGSSMFGHMADEPGETLRHAIFISLCLATNPHYSAAQCNYFKPFFLPRAKFQITFYTYYIVYKTQTINYLY